MPKIKFSQRFTDHLIQAVLIFTSVFVAFWLTDFREKQNINRIVNLALENVASEMSYNHKRVEATYSYYLRILSYLDSLQNSQPEKLNNLHGYQIPRWQGVQMPMLRSSAYQTILGAGIGKDMPFEVLKALSFIYHVQSVIERGDDSFIEKAVSDMDFTRLAKVRHFFILYTDILPDVITNYQILGKKHLEKFGYTSKVENEQLRNLIEIRSKNLSNY
jgi:hypothetical protein